VEPKGSWGRSKGSGRCNKKLPGKFLPQTPYSPGPRLSENRLPGSLGSFKNQKGPKGERPFARDFLQGGGQKKGDLGSEKRGSCAKKGGETTPRGLGGEKPTVSVTKTSGGPGRCLGNLPEWKGDYLRPYPGGVLYIPKKGLKNVNGPSVRHLKWS